MIGGEEQGIPVAIGHVSLDGPAAGVLQVYDELRSINGKWIVLFCFSPVNDKSYNLENLSSNYLSADYM